MVCCPGRVAPSAESVSKVDVTTELDALTFCTVQFALPDGPLPGDLVDEVVSYCLSLGGRNGPRDGDDMATSQDD